MTKVHCRVIMVIVERHPRTNTFRNVTIWDRSFDFLDAPNDTGSLGWFQNGVLFNKLILSPAWRAESGRIWVWLLYCMKWCFAHATSSAS